MSRGNTDNSFHRGGADPYLQRIFREIILAIGGVFYLHPVPDEAVWATARSLDKIFRRALVDDEPAPGTDRSVPAHSQGRKHPAIVELLRHMNDPECIFPRGGSVDR